MAATMPQARTQRKFLEPVPIRERAERAQVEAHVEELLDQVERADDDDDVIGHDAEDAGVGRLRLQERVRGVQKMIAVDCVT